jgi:hypothetical protein
MLQASHSAAPVTMPMPRARWLSESAVRTQATPPTPAAAAACRRSLRLVARDRAGLAAGAFSLTIVAVVMIAPLRTACTTRRPGALRRGWLRSGRGPPRPRTASAGLRRRVSPLRAVADLDETEDGYKITIRRSKTDQEGHGVTIATRAASRPAPSRPSRRGCRPPASARGRYSGP